MSSSFEAEFVTAAQLRARYGGVSKMWLERRLESPDFPRPVHLGTRLRHWRMSEILKWERATIAGNAARRPIVLNRNARRR
jgi:predicted DNA-binding transcriptional regulator AlpA